MTAHQIRGSIFQRAAAKLRKPFEHDAGRLAERVRIDGLDDPESHVRAERESSSLTGAATWPHSFRIARSERAGS